VSGVDARLSAYDIFIFDLDGVVVLGHEPIGGAVEAINDLARSGVHLAYATNNASRAGSDVADLLVSLGITASADEVITSAQASARILAQRLAPGDPVLIVGGPALRDEVTAVGLTPVTSADDRPRAVVQGYAAEVGWNQLAEACVAVRAGATWVATNADRTLPSPRGELPGNGSLVAALATALDRQPDLIVGKPAATLFRTAADRVGARKPLVVGDRLDTDIAGAVNAKMDSLLVLTGVSTPEDLLTAAAGHRPTYVAADLRGLISGVVPVPDRPSDTGPWRVARSDRGLELDGSGPTVAALAALASAAWAAAGDAGSAEAPEITAASADAARALRELHLSS
jgi:HAD superfamily hydrolase (TIGR01450 family)